MANPILVTGEAGRTGGIGRMVNELLLKQGKAVRAMVRSEDERARASIDASTINTREAERDAHLRSADFFDVERFPTLSFSSTQVKRTGDDELAVTGDVAVHGGTRQVTFQVEGPTVAGKDPWGNTRIGLSATVKINRKEFGLTWNTALGTGGILVGEDVTVTLDLEFVKA